MSDLIAGDGDAAARGNVEAAEKIQQGGFAGAAGTHERDEFARGHIEIESLKDVDLFTAAAIGFVEVTNLDEAGLCHPLPSTLTITECSYF